MQNSHLQIMEHCWNGGGVLNETRKFMMTLEDHRTPDLSIFIFEVLPCLR